MSARGAALALTLAAAAASTATPQAVAPPQAAPPQADDPVLVIHGETYSTGLITLTVDAPDGYDGSPVWFVLGLDALPLHAPVSTSKGAFFVGQIALLKPLGTLPVGAPLDVSVALPEVPPGAEGLHLVLQMLLPGRLSNPATLPWDAPYFQAADATALTAPNPVQAAHFGDRHVVGDFNGDGVRDLAVGAWFEDATFSHEGRVHVSWGPSFASSTTLSSPAPASWHLFGIGLAAADLDGDEADELIVAEASGYPDQLDDPGRLWIYGGGSGFSSESTPQLVTGPASGDEAAVFGRATIAGDFNADGAIDLAAHVPSADVAGLESAGRIDVFWGPDFEEWTSLESPDPSESSFFGSRMITADVNGDGIDDLVEAGSRDDYDGVDNLGRLHVFLGPGLTHFKTIDNPLPMGFNSRFGNSLAVGDFNGDGADEIVTSDQRGHAYVFWSPAFESYQLIRATPSASVPSASFGYFADVGDVNGDGLLDVVIADPFAEGTGVAYVYLGPYLATALEVREPLPEANAEFAWRPSLVDIDGDGLEELIAGSNTGNVGAVPGAGRLTIMDLDSGR